MTDIVARAKAALEGVTEGPWKPRHAGNVHYGVSHGDYDFPTVVKAHAQWDGFGSGSRQADAVFVAAARSLVPELVDRVEHLEAVLFQIREARVDYDGALLQRRHGHVVASNFIADVFNILDRDPDQ